MAIDKFLIAPLNSGLENNVRPFLLQNDAYERLENAYLFRGRVRKRFGSQFLNDSVDISLQQLFSRLRINIGNTPGPLNIPGTATQLQIGQMFSVGNDMFTVFQLGLNVLTLSTNPAATARINTTVNPNTVTFTGEPPGTAVFYYPSTPVMGFTNLLAADVLYVQVFAFDTQFAYQFIAGAWTRLGTAIWTGTDLNFFWATNWQGATSDIVLLFVTNFNPPDQIKYWNNNTATWTTINPQINAAGDTLETCLMLIPFQDRLLALNNVVKVSGANTTFTNQVRWSVDGDPTSGTAFRQDIPGQGGFLNAPTKEDIISAQIIKNRLIVEFEDSTWELVYTSNQVEPFRWQSINIELGAQSTFAHIPFDKFILGVGNQGITSCNGVNVERIDLKIIDEILKIQNDNGGQKRVYGVRDYHLEMVYWTYPDFTNNPIYPNRIFVYNYRTQTWAFNDDSITCFGYFLNQPDDIWANDTQLWMDDSSTWQSGFNQSNNTQVLAGNQEGYTFLCIADLTVNAPALQITNLILSAGGLTATLTVINHNLYTGDYIQITNCVGVTGINALNFAVMPVPSDPNSFTIVCPTDSLGNPLPFGGAYLGAGTIARVSVIDILTKQYNFYMNEARNCFVQKVDFYVDSTDFGEITIDTLASSAGSVSMIEEGIATGSLVGTSVLETVPYALSPLEAAQDRFWHPVYFQVDGEVIQLELYLSEAQLLDPLIAASGFQLNAMLFWTEKTSIGFTSG